MKCLLCYDLSSRELHFKSRLAWVCKALTVLEIKVCAPPESFATACATTNEKTKKLIGDMEWSWKRCRYVRYTLLILVDRDSRGNSNSDWSESETERERLYFVAHSSVEMFTLQYRLKIIDIVAKHFREHSLLEPEIQLSTVCFSNFPNIDTRCHSVMKYSLVNLITPCTEKIIS